MVMIQMASESFIWTDYMGPAGGHIGGSATAAKLCWDRIDLYRLTGEAMGKGWHSGPIIYVR